MTRTIYCPCGALTTTECSFSADGPDCTLAGFRVVANHEGRITYLCPPCGQRALDLARELYAIVGERCMYFPSLLPKEQDQREKLRIAEPTLQRVAVEVEAPAVAEETVDQEAQLTTLGRAVARLLPEEP